MSLGAAMALLIGGTGASLPEIAILGSMLRPKAIAAYVLWVFITATLGGFIFYALFTRINLIPLRISTTFQK